MKVTIVALLAVSVIAFARAAAPDERFSESLLVVPLVRGRVALRMEFVTASATADSDYGVFPKPLAQLAATFGVRELHASFTQGRWLTESWGHAPEGSEAPQGADLWAWFANSSSSAGNDDATVSGRWAGLRNSLSGLLCSSLNHMGDELSSSPHEAIQRPLVEFDSTVGHSAVRHASLPKEATCTENLTPWVRFLPCRDRAGIGALLNPLLLYGVPYNSMSLHLTYAASGALSVRQVLTVVMDGHAKGDFSLRSAFALAPNQRGRPSVASGISACPIAQESTVRVAVLPDGAAASVSPVDRVGRVVSGDGKVVSYDLLLASPLPLSVASAAFPSDAKRPDILVTAHRFLSGFGQMGGGLHTRVRNENPSLPVAVTMYDSMPFFVRPYLSSLAVSVNGTLVDPHKVFTWLRFTPGTASSPAVLEAHGTLPPLTDVSVTMQYESVFLHLSKHPPDANRGWDLPAGIVVVEVPDVSPSFPGVWPVTAVNSSGSSFIILRTEGLLLSLPTPDFSMPYNVITMSCTLAAMFYGSVLTLSTRRWRSVFTGTAFVTERPVVRLAKFLWRNTLGRFMKSSSDK